MKNRIQNFVIIAMFGILENVSLANVQHPIFLSSKIFMVSQLPFITHSNDNALSMNVPYQPIAEVRNQLSTSLKYQLKFFQGWNLHGEAHITVVTPPEYKNSLSKFVSIGRINEIAMRNRIQSSDLQILGLGVGQAFIDRQRQSTYFIIAFSRNLLFIRQQIYLEYLKNGGPKDGWNPLHFYPHITIGFTMRDLHEQDGVLKDISHSLDQRFQLILTN